MSPVPVFQKPTTQIFLRIVLPVFTAITALAVYQFGVQIIAETLYATSIKFRFALWAGSALTAGLTLLSALAWGKSSQRILRSLTSIQKTFDNLGSFAPILLLALPIFFPLIVFSFYGRFLLAPFPRLFLFLSFVLMETCLLGAWRKKDWLSVLPAAALGLAIVYSTATFFNQVSMYPFSLEWSEVSRYYQASFFFSKQVYGVQLPLPVTHPSRYLLQAIPFLIANLPLWLHRLWQALLWVGMPLLTAWVFARRLKLGSNILRWLFIGWSFLFLMQGAVFYHLLPCVFLVLWGFDKNRPARSFLFVALASIWAGISRVNWIPLPGALAVLLYMLEVRPKESQTFSLRYLWQPLLYGLGGSLVALASYAFYIANSGVKQLDQFSSPFTADLLWQRLLPNGAFPPGVLLGIVLVSAPLLALIWLLLRSKGNGIGAWRVVVITTLLSVFFLGGLVVSVKIGGGTNLHNMDAYLVLLWVLASVVFFGKYTSGGTKSTLTRPMTGPLLTALLTLPILFAVFSGGPLDLPDRQVALDALAQIQKLVGDAALDGREVLFISQRHLLTFHMVESVPLVHEYEKLFLMEMAISHNDAYLSRFWDQIDEQQFALIITDPLNTNIYNDVSDTLAPENNAWVREVSKPVLCAYEPLVTFSDLGIQVLQPRLQKCNQ